MEIKQEALNHFMGMWRERYNMYYLASKRPRVPTSDDPILAKYWFCNVQSCMDDFTVRLLKYFGKSTPEDMRARLVLRFFCCPPLLASASVQDARFRENPTSFIESWISAGKRLDCSYMIMSAPTKGTPAFHEFLKILCDVGTDLHNVLDCLNGITVNACASYIADRVPRASYITATRLLGDLRYTEYAERLEDLDTWGYAGQNATRGLARLFPREAVSFAFGTLGNRTNYDLTLQLRSAVTDHLRVHKGVTPEAIAYIEKNNPTAARRMWTPDVQDILQWLMQYDLYCRIKEKRGEPFKGQRQPRVFRED